MVGTANSIAPLGADLRACIPHRLGTLDGLRGVAALVVLIHHAAPRTWGFDVLPSGYLAVDLFFMLSGFVLARTYEARFAGQLGFATFMGRRLRRLYPVMAVGIMVGAFAARAQGLPSQWLLVHLAAQLLFIPIISGSVGLYILNGVQWSLALELLANAIHATVLRRVTTRRLSVGVVFCFISVALAARANGSIAMGDTGLNIAG